MKASTENAAHGFKLLLKKQPNNFYEWFDFLNEVGFFKPENNPAPEPAPKGQGVIIRYWGTLPYILEVAKYAGEHNNTALAEKVISIIRDVSAYKSDDEHIDNYHTWSTFAEILSYLPSSVVTEDDLNLLSIWLSSKYDTSLVGHDVGLKLLPKLLQDVSSNSFNKACMVLEQCLTIKWDTVRRGKKKEVASIIDDHWLRNIVDKNIKDFSEKCPEAAASIFLAKLKEVYKVLEQEVPSYSTRPAIEDHEQNFKWKGVENILVDGLRDILINWIEKDFQNAKEFIVKLIKDETEICRRIAIYLVNMKFDTLRSATKDILPLLSDTEHLHEMYEFLQYRFANFLDSEKEQTLQLINKLYTDNASSDKVALYQRLQKRWLTAIINKGCEKADLLYQELNTKPELAGMSPNPSFLSYMTFRSGPGPSIYNESELLSFLEKGTIVTELNYFQEDKQDWDGPTTRALVDVLESAASSEPLKFALNINAFLSAESPYQHGVIRGLKNAWDKTKKDQTGQWDSKIWELLISFLEALINEKTFWERVKDEPENEHLAPAGGWIPSLIAEFMQSAVNNDNAHAPKIFFPRVFAIIKILLAKLPYDDKADVKDPLNKAINTSRGKAIEALITYALFMCRNEQKEKGSHVDAWQQVETLFDSELAACKNENYDFSALLGNYINQFGFMSFEWLERNIKKAFPVEFQTNFLCALGGLAYAQEYGKVYVLLRDANIITHALSLEVESSQTKERLLERIALAYIWGDESITGTNMNTIFESNNQRNLGIITVFLGRIYNKDFESDYISRVIEFWKRCIKWKESQESTPESLLSKLNLLAAYLTEINAEQKEWLLLSAPYAELKYNADNLLEELDRLADENCKAVMEVLDRLLSNYSPYSDYQGILQSLIIKIWDGGFHREANDFMDQLRHIEAIESLHKNLNGK